MGIDSNRGTTNDFSPADAQSVEENQERHTNFSGTDLGGGGAAMGSMDFVSLQSRIGISRIGASVAPYLEKVLEIVQKNLPNVTMITLTRLQNSYAFKFDGSDGTVNFFGIQFASTGDPVSTNYYPVSVRLDPMHDELRDRYKDTKIRLCDARVIIGGYEPDMERYYEMADTIVRTFQVTSIPELKLATIASITTNEFVADWRLAEAKNAESQLSPHGIRPRMDIGLTIKAKISNGFGRELREFDTDYRTLGVIGGYAEFRVPEEFTVNNQRVMLWRPVFNITVLNATVPLEGVAAILLAAFAPSIYNTQYWLKQFANLGDDQPNPGSLEEDPDNRGRPMSIKNQEDLLEFNRVYFAQPIIAFQFQDGRDSIPGVWRMGATDNVQKNHLVSRLSKFFESSEQTDATGVELSRIIEKRFDGAVGDPKGTLSDSRDIDYLSIAAKNGWGSIDGAMKQTLLNGNTSLDSAVARARIVQNVSGSFMPLYLTTIAAINPDFIKWIIQRTDQRRLVLIDPNSQMDARSIGSVLDGFGSSTGMGSIVSSGVVNRGLGLSSIWNKY